MHWTGAADWLCLFLEYLIKTGLALSIALFLVSVLHKRPASTRHFVLSFFMIGVLLIPVFSELRFGWETNLLPSSDVTVRDLNSTVPPAEPSSEPPRAINPRSVTDARIAAPPPDSALPASDTMFLASETDFSMGIAGTYLPLIWSAGCAMLLLRLGIGILGAYRLTRHGENLADPTWMIMLARVLAFFGLRRPVRLKSHREVAIPFTWGFIRPVILFPASYEQWTEEQRSSALLHEVTHIKRADFLVMLLVCVSRAIFWFNPLTWIVFRRLKKEQERACDDLVLTTGIKPSAYAAALLSFKRSSEFQVSASPAFPGLLGGASFNDRLAAILKERLTDREATMRTKLLLAILVILSVAFIGLARPAKTSIGNPPKPEVNLTEAHMLWSAHAQAVEIASGHSGQEKKAETQEGKKEEPRKIVVKNAEGETVPIEVTIVSGGQTGEIKKKLEDLQAKLDPTKQVDVNEIKEAIQEILADLARQEAGDRVVLKAGGSSKDLYIVQDKEGSGQRWIVRKADKDTRVLNAVIVKFEAENAAWSMASMIAPGEASKAVYERIVEKVRQEMPEGYQLDPEFNEKSGAITLKFTGNPAGVVSKEFLKKLADIIKGEIK